MTQTHPKTPRADQFQGDREAFQVASADTMKAIVYTTYGSPDVLQSKEVAKPTPKDDEVLIKVYAAAANAGDWHLLRGVPFLVRLVSGVLKPKNTILGADIAGRVEAVGRNVTQFQPDDEVFGDLSGCGFGGFAEYVCARENALALKPANLSFEEAAAVPSAGVTALQGLREKGQIKLGQKVLINGASGGVGTFAVQIAKSFGAEVTGVCSTRNVDMVRSIGADQVIDYTKEDFTKSAQRYDLIIDNVGNHSLLECRRALNPKGKYVMVGGPAGRWIDPLPRVLNALVLSRFVSQDMSMFLAELNKEDLTILRDLMQAGKVKPVIDRQYRLSEVPKAIGYLEEGHARGKV